MKPDFLLFLAVVGVAIFVTFRKKINLTKIGETVRNFLQKISDTLPPAPPPAT